MADIAEMAMVSAPDDGELVLPVPADAPPIPDAHFKLGRPRQRWLYCDPAGAALFLIVRFDKIDGGKEFWPLTLHGLIQRRSGEYANFGCAAGHWSR